MDGPRQGDVQHLLIQLRTLRGELQVNETHVTRYEECIARSEAENALALKNGESLRRKLLQLEASSKKCKEMLGVEDGVEVEELVQGARGSLGRMDRIKPSTGSLFVRLFLGQVNVRAASSTDKMVLRDEFEKFRFRTNFGFIIFPLIWTLDHFYLRTIWRYTHWIHILTHVWLLYYYVSLALRTNILKVNGSSIKSWWIYHHYVSALMSMIALTWPPESKTWDSFSPYFTAYFLYQGLVQFVQSHYQQARLYVRRTIGKATHMDVSHTETIDEFHSGLWLVVILVFVAHACQVSVGVMVLSRLNLSLPWYSFREEAQCAGLGSLFIFLGVVNFSVTWYTLLEKWASSAKLRLPRRDVSAQEDFSSKRLVGASATNLASLQQPTPVTVNPGGIPGEEINGAGAATQPPVSSLRQRG